MHIEVGFDIYGLGSRHILALYTGNCRRYSCIRILCRFCGECSAGAQQAGGCAKCQHSFLYISIHINHSFKTNLSIFFA